jgi:hypothetical protein
VNVPKDNQRLPFVILFASLAAVCLWAMELEPAIAPAADGSPVNLTPVLFSIGAIVSAGIAVFLLFGLWHRR